jgi:ornithine cyclodeaminase/alanine dehydrogenase-like protein (mu-crystallin family)
MQRARQRRPRAGCTRADVVSCATLATQPVDTVEALQKSGDLLGPMSRGVFVREDVAATLESLCRTQDGRRGDPQVRTVFKSVGTALEDLAAAILVYEG